LPEQHHARRAAASARARVACAMALSEIPPMPPPRSVAPQAFASHSLRDVFIGHFLKQ
jgi:hypothetical protein